MRSIRTNITAVIIENKNVIKNGFKCFKCKRTSTASTAAKNPEISAKTYHIVSSPISLLYMSRLYHKS